jgi:hypothetical protein
MAAAINLHSSVRYSMASEYGRGPEYAAGIGLGNHRSVTRAADSGADTAPTASADTGCWSANVTIGVSAVSIFCLEFADTADTDKTQ